MISGDNEEIQANKYLLSVFSPTLRPLLSTPCCTSPTLLLPDCSTSSIKHLLNIITTGFTSTQEVTDDDNNEINDTANTLSINVKDLVYVDNTNCYLLFLFNFIGW